MPTKLDVLNKLEKLYDLKNPTSRIKFEHWQHVF